MALLGGEVMRACGVLAVRLRQIYRQAPRLIEQVQQVNDELTIIVDSCDQAREMVCDVLALDQQRRTRKDKGE